MVAVNSSSSPCLLITEPLLYWIASRLFFLRLIKKASHKGIVFRFVDITDKQLDILDYLSFNLPTIGPSEEASVPFEEIISRDRPHNSELLEETLALL